MRAVPALSELTGFQQDGFLVVRGFLEPGRLADVRRWTEEIATEPEGPGRQMVYYEDNLVLPGQRIGRVEERRGAA